ncbi:TetR/AcrR family transcriptional regulator [Amycolatopsis acidicola]|uniref:TetR/AcrR family transcriptional regulator n=1 Tax=Amycolatopsis acidicola TaxID=2596893 RepID=A0A5N0ULN6_9PSEU|nr:TetR/AcrR family transcriptional regulator [Amycolatopsis acidicola]KAA9150848.1 TetR/AcrR family transcriptional regulator [Amycolatopsis acidicola]
MPEGDRRTRRTRRLLRDALVSLVPERGYTDKDAVLSQVVKNLTEELDERLRPLVAASSRGFTGKPVLEMFRHALEERDTYRIILRGEGDGRALREFVDARAATAAAVFQARADHAKVAPRIDMEVPARAWVGQQITVLGWWLEAEPPRPGPEEVTEVLLNLSLRGRFWANGFDGPAPDAVEE